MTLDWGLFCDYSYDVIRGSNVRTLYLKVLLDSWLKYESSELLFDFLAGLVQKLGQKTANQQGAFLNTSWGFTKLVFRFFGPNLGTRNAKNPFGPLKVPKCNQKQLD